MDVILRPIFSVLTVPDLKIKQPTWLHTPSAWTIFAFILTTYFLVTGGIIYDVIVEPPSVGSTTDEHGHTRPVAFMPYRVNGQYIMEGLASSFMFSLGGAGMMVLDQTHNPSTPKINRMMLQVISNHIYPIYSLFLAKWLPLLDLTTKFISSLSGLDPWQ